MAPASFPYQLVPGTLATLAFFWFIEFAKLLLTSEPSQLSFLFLEADPPISPFLSHLADLSF